MTTHDKIPYAEQKRRGQAIYDAQIRHLISPDDADKFVKIDILTGDYEIHENPATAGRKLRERRSDAVIHTIHRGQSDVVRLRSPRRVVPKARVER